MTSAKKPYHHGDLRAALLSAAESELAEKGVERFTLRGVARRAGVSHAAPAHHFADTDAMLTALAASGFERFLQAVKAATTGNTPRQRLISSGVGYVGFALDNPALFRLMFGSQRPDSDDPALTAHAIAGFDDLVERIGAIRGDTPMRTDDGRMDVAATWSNVHGLATLLIDGRMRFLAAELAQDRPGTLYRLIGRGVPSLKE